MKIHLVPLVVVGFSTVATAQQASGQKFMAPLGSMRQREMPFQQFDMVDDTGHPLKPTDMMELSNGKVVSAQEFYASLNRLERGLNKIGHSLREPGTVRKIDLNFADTRAIQNQFSDYTKLSRAVNQMSVPNRKALIHAKEPMTTGGATKSRGGNSPLSRPGVSSPGTLIRPRSGSSTRINSGPNPIFSGSGSGTSTALTRQGAGSSKFGGALRNELTTVLAQGTTLGKDATTNLSWGVDKPFGDNNMGVRLKASLSLNASSINSATPPTLSGSTTNIKATFNGGCQGTLLGTRFDILNASCEIGTSSNAKDVSLGWNVNVAGFQVLTGSKSYGDSLQWSDGYSIPFQKQSQTMEFPIFGPFACSGFVGIEGEAGIKANIALNPIYAEADIVPYVKAGVYGEVLGGLDLEVASAWGGLHADLTLVDDQFTLGANLGIVALPGNKIGWADEAYVRNSVNLFTGTLSLVAHIFGPGGVKIQDWEYPFYTVRGYHDESTLFHTGAVHELSWGGN